MYDIDCMSEQERKQSHEISMTFILVAKMLLPAEMFQSICTTTSTVYAVQVASGASNVKKYGLSGIKFTVYDPDEGGENRDN